MRRVIDMHPRQAALLEASRQMWAAHPVAMEFPSEEALREYMKQHPGADPKNHSVKRNETDVMMDNYPSPKPDKGHTLPDYQMDPKDTPGLVDRLKQRGVSDQDIARMLMAKASRVLHALTIPREFHLPQQVRGTDPINPEGTDLYVWKYEQSGQGGQMFPFAIAFAGKSNKPLWHHSFRTEQQRDAAIEREAENRRTIMLAKLKKQQERKEFQHTFEVGDILYSSWGYDQTNINFYQVIEAKGKEIILREVGSRVVGGRGGPSEKVMAEPNEFIGPPMRKRPQGSGTHVYVKIDQSQMAWEWDGSPEHQTGSGYGH